MYCGEFAKFAKCLLLLLTLLLLATVCANLTATAYRIERHGTLIERNGLLSMPHHRNQQQQQHSLLPLGDGESHRLRHARKIARTMRRDDAQRASDERYRRDERSDRWAASGASVDGGDSDRRRAKGREGIIRLDGRIACTNATHRRHHHRRLPGTMIATSVLYPSPYQRQRVHDEDEAAARRAAARPQRSPAAPPSRKSGDAAQNDNGNHQQHQKRKRYCQEKDVARDAYRANTVVLARAESMSSNRVANYSVTFRVLKRYKNKYRVEDKLRLTFLTESNNASDARRGASHCEPDFFENASGGGAAGGRRATRGLIKARIQQSKEYYLFLNGDGRHRYVVRGAPVPRRKRARGRRDGVETTIRRITDSKFVLKEPNKPTITTIDRFRLGDNVKIACQVRGFPVPYLTWRKDGTVLRQNESLRIAYKRRKTTLKIIKVKTKDFGRYECVATGLDNRAANESVDIRINSEDKYGEECPEHLRDMYCENGGTCYKHAEIQETFCVCGEGFAGARCEVKEVIKSSSTYTCKLGISTSYYC